MRGCRQGRDAFGSIRGLGRVAENSGIRAITRNPRLTNACASRAKADATTQRDRGLEPHVLLLTGAPGVGKTTVIRGVAEQLEAERLRGFYTEEIREGGERRGFRLVGLEGKECVIAHVAFSRNTRVGKYGVDVAAMDNAASLLAPDPGAQVYLVDEIGKMECLSERFVTAMRVLLTGQTPVVATVGLRGLGFISEVKRSEACLVWVVTHANRDELPSRIVAWLVEA